MDFFISTFRNRIDAKGRVSVPAPYRALLSRQGPEGGVFVAPDLVAGATYEARALVGGGATYLAGIHAQIAQLPEFSDEREAMEQTLLAQLVLANFDPEGRITLPAVLLEHSGLATPGEAVFVGRGTKFQIWEPQAWAAREAAAKSVINAKFRAGAAGKGGAQ